MKNIPLIRNPLTVIAVFASLTEVVCGTVAPFIEDTSNQKIFLFFTIGFPSLLVTTFFITLNFNHKVLYSPSDFENSDKDLLPFFYGQKKEALLERDTNTGVVKKNFLTTTNFDKLNADVRPQYEFAKLFYNYIIKLINNEKLEEVNFDSLNNTVYSLEIRLKSELLKDPNDYREAFVLLIWHDNEYNTETDEYSEEKLTKGSLAGSGLGSEVNNYEKLGNFVVSKIIEKLK